MQKGDALKITAVISLVVLGILLIGSLIFYKERMLFSDAAWIAFHTINTGSIQIQVDRFGSFITQMFPVIGSKLGLSLKAILILYSLSFNLFYFITALLLFRMRRYALVVLLALYFTIFVSDAFFWTNNEVYQGVTWMFLLFGTIISLYNKLAANRLLLFYVLSFALFIPLVFLAIYTHPLVMIPTIFLWVFLALSGKEKFFRSKHSIVFAAIIITVAVFKTINSTNNCYDGNILQKVFKANISEIAGTFTNHMADIFWKNLISNHWLIAIIFLTGIIHLIKEKKYLLAICTVGGCVGYFILICLTFSDGSKPYIESEWMCLTILGAAPFVYYVIPSLKHKNALLILSFIFLVRMSYIAIASPRYIARITMITTISDIMKERGITKAIIRRTDDRLEKKLVIGWALPIETLFISILNNDNFQRTALCLNEEEIKRYTLQDPAKGFISPFWTGPASELNTEYFRMDTIQMYRLYTYEEFFGDRISVLTLD